MKYDYLIVGSGIYGAVCAHELSNDGCKVLVVEKRNHIAGNSYTEKVEGINVHKYGPHIFHTNIDRVWEYVNQFANFNNFVNRPKANYKGEIYSLPFNMYTFEKMWGIKTGEEAKAIIENQRAEAKIGEPKNLEEQAISLVGKDIYEKLVKGYTEKQWGRDCKELPPSIIKRLPVRFEYNDNYFDAKYQGIPIGGYTGMIEKMLSGSDVMLNTDYLSDRDNLDKLADKVIYTGSIDAFFDYSEGHLEYRTVRFENEVLNQKDYQGNAVINYTDRQTPYTRIIEHKHFEFGNQEKTVISKEFSMNYTEGCEPYYPINDNKNTECYQKYKSLSEKQNRVIFGGRLGEYKYYNMDDVIESALNMLETKIK